MTVIIFSNVGTHTDIAEYPFKTAEAGARLGCRSLTEYLG
jgi:hypothetical protein